MVAALRPRFADSQPRPALDVMELLTFLMPSLYPDTRHYSISTQVTLPAERYLLKELCKLTREESRVVHILI